MSTRGTVAERLDRLSMPEPNSGCILFLGSLDKHGYGQIGVGRKSVGAHRVAYEEAVGPVPEGLQIDHLCRNRGCINPRHLEPVTQRINGLRGHSPPARDARVTHCPKGHPYDSDNTYRDSKGHRRCRACGRAATHASRRRRLDQGVTE